MTYNFSKKMLFFGIFLFYSFSIFAQYPTRLTQDAIGTYQVVAFMVEFQPDSDSLTFGKGTFVTTPADTGFLDTYPHDMNYFSGHLTFLKNYWERASNNLMTVDPHLYSSVLILPQQMSYYSPVNVGDDSAYIRLFRDFIRVAESKVGLDTWLTSVVGEKEKTHFILFHAGLGRDVNWIPLLGADPTPYDIPSIFLSEEKITDYFESFSPVNSNWKIIFSNLSILPETLNRVISSFNDRKILINLGINGLMIANFGNFLGLPDLFDTKTGRTMIGRFGLMDGNGFFNYNGFFPVEPNIWEKYQLGWIQPSLISYHEPVTKNIRLHSTFSDHYSDSSAVFIHLGNSRYYLLENKKRYSDQLSGNKQTIYTSFQNQSITTSYQRDENGFNLYTLSDLKGVVTDVDNLSWFSPGGLDDKADTISGGVLIWKLDDTKIQQVKSSKGKLSVNTDKNNRGLYLIEADGAFEIGMPSSNSLFSNPFEVGVFYDYWYQGNIATKYTNTFSKLSTPSSNWDYQIPTGVELTQFSIPKEIGTLQLSIQSPTFDYQIFKTNFQLLKPGNIIYPTILDFKGDWLMVYVSGDTLVVQDGNEIIYQAKTSRNEGQIPFAFRSTFSNFYLTLVSATVNNEPSIKWISYNGLSLHTGEFGLGVNDVILPNERLIELNNYNEFEIKIVDTQLNELHNLYVQMDGSFNKEIVSTNFNIMNKPDGKLWSWYIGKGIPAIFSVIMYNGIVQQLVPADQYPISFIEDSTFGFVFSSNLPVIQLFSTGGFSIGDKKIISDNIGKIRQATVLSNVSDQIVFLGSENTVHGYINDRVLSGFPVEFQKPINRLVTVYINGETMLWVLSGTEWFEVNIFRSGEKKYLPISLSKLITYDVDFQFFSAEMKNDQSATISTIPVLLLSDGLTSDFPFRSGVAGQGIISQKQYHIQNLTNSSFLYSWPNPSKDGQVNLRYRFQQSGKLVVRITDIRGQIIETISTEVIANEESEFYWNGRSQPSGLYFASVSAPGYSSIVKIMIAK